MNVIEVSVPAGGAAGPADLAAALARLGEAVRDDVAARFAGLGDALRAGLLTGKAGD